MIYCSAGSFQASKHVCTVETVALHDGHPESTTQSWQGKQKSHQYWKAFISWTDPLFFFFFWPSVNALLPFGVQHSGHFFQGESPSPRGKEDKNQKRGVKIIHSRTLWWGWILWLVFLQIYIKVFFSLFSILPQSSPSQKHNNGIHVWLITLNSKSLQFFGFQAEILSLLANNPHQILFRNGSYLIAAHV